MSSHPIIAGRYQIIERIGKGGMGEVYKATDLQTSMTVALKSLKSELLEDDPDLLTRFRREAELLGQLNHPNIVQTMGLVEQNGTHYLIMEYISGGDLGALIKREGKLPIKRVLQIALDLADALTRAHRLKIIHRDIKPSNILLTETGTPKLTDFGVARLNDGDTPQMTKTGSMVGTYSYLSPEAVQAKEVDARTDIWAFGVMLFEMLTGKRPFDRDNTTATLLAIINEPLPDIPPLRPDIPPLLVPLIMKMLEKDLRFRIPSIRHVGAELESIIEKGDTAIRPAVVIDDESRFSTPTPSSATLSPFAEDQIIETRILSEVLPPAPTPVVAPVKRSWTPLVAFLGIVVMLIGGVGFLIASGNREASTPAATATPALVQIEPAPPGKLLILVAAFEPINTTPRDVSRFIADDLQQSIEISLPNLNAVVRPYPNIIFSADQALEAAQLNQAAMVIWGNYTASRVEVQLQVTILEETALDPRVITEASAVRLEMTDENQQTLAPHVISALAIWHSIYGDVYSAGVAMLSLEVRFGEPATITGTTVGAHLYHYFDHFFPEPEQAVAEMDQATLLSSTNPMSYHFRGVVRQAMGDFDSAGQDLTTALRLTDEGWAAPIIALANNEIQANRDAEAIDLFTRALEIKPGYWFVYNLRAAAHYFNRDYALARADYEQAIVLEPPSNLPYIGLTSVAMREGQVTESIALMDTALRRFPDPTVSQRLLSMMSGGSESINDFNSAALSAFTNLILGQFDQAINSVDAALAIDQSYGDFYLLKGLAYCNLHDYAAAEAAYTAGLEVEPDLAILNLMRAEVRQRQNNLVGALQDISVVQNSSLWASVEPLMADPTATSCETFF